MLVEKGTKNDGQYKGFSMKDNFSKLIGRIRDGSSHDVPVISTTNVNDGNFHHIVYVVDRSAQTSNLYIDNILQATTSISSVGSIDSSVNLLFGGQASPNTQIDFYSGILDQIRMYNRALSTADIQSLFNEGGSSGLPGTVAGTIQVGSSPTGIGVNTQTNKIYVANEFSNTVSVIDATTNTVIKTIPVGTRPLDVDVNMQTNKIYVANYNSNTVSVIDGTTDTVVSTITVGSNPQLAAVNPTTNKVFITNNLSNTVSVIDGGSNTVVSTIPVAAGPGGIGINTVTNKIYYPTNSGTVQVIDGNSNAIITTISVGGSPDYIGVNAITNKIYVADISSTIVTIINGL